MFMAWIIASMCSSNQSIDQNACSHFLEASAKQTQIYQYSDKAEDYFKIKAKNETNALLGSKAEDIVGGTYFVYKSYKNKSIDIKLPNMGLCNTINTHVGQDNNSLNFGWNF